MSFDEVKQFCSHLIQLEKMKLTKYILLAVALLSLGACTSQFEEINTNPNAPIDVQPSLLLRQVLWDYAEQMSFEGFVAGNLLSQHFAEVDFNLFDRHSLTEPQFGGNPWPIIYVNLRDTELILDRARNNPAAAVYEGPALVMKAYLAAAATDIFGDVPYSDALKGKEGNVAPAYDSQEDIYLAEGGILDNLEQAVAVMEAYQGAIPLEGDIIFDGDLNAWVRMANSLRIKYLMRISNRVDVGADLQAIFDEGNFIQENADNAAFDFSSTPPNNYRLATARVGDFVNFVMSETIEEIMLELEDPRINVFFRPTESGNAPEYQGLLNGQDASQTSITVADYSLPGTIFRETSSDLDANYITAWETHFFLAEAAARGLINADEQSLYEQGVEQAFAYWQTELPATYLTDSPAAFGANGADPVEQILTQKWLASIVNGYEGWIEWRRTGFPALKTIAASLNNDLIPRRMPYPTDEQALNAANFDLAAAATDGNSVNAAVWWDR